MEVSLGSKDVFLKEVSYVSDLENFLSMIRLVLDRIIQKCEICGNSWLVDLGIETQGLIVQERRESASGAHCIIRNF